MRKFAPIRSGDDKLDRVQDAVAKAFGQIGPTIVQVSSLPQASSAAPQIVQVVARGSPTRLLACVINSAGGYEWLSLGTSS